MKTLINVVGLIAISACAPNKTTLPIVVDSQLAPYFAAFQSDIGVSTAGISAQFQAQQAPIIGYCSVDADGNRLISIDPSWWGTMTDLGKEQLMYHELGHCAMGYGHINDQVQSNEGIPIAGHIMYMYWFGGTWYYSEYRGAYLAGLRNHSLLNVNGSDTLASDSKNTRVFVETFDIGDKREL